MDTRKTLFWIDAVILSLLVILAVGVPLLFTSYTRSVFEVNKMLILRLVSIGVYGLWLFRYLLLRDNGIDHSSEESFSILGMRWKKIGLEWPMLAWFLLNILSLIFSQNIRIAIVGAYDRWEGIVTIANYLLLWLMIAKLIRTKTHAQIFLWSLIIPTLLSSFYGIFQSFGLDFMSWSVDPTHRVFACINNPVHFCAYVGMIVPLCVGGLMMYADRPYSKMRSWVQWGIFLMTIVIYYAQFLSFSRATWLGFIGSMTLFYLLMTDTFCKESKKRFVWDVLLTLFAIASYYILYIFNFNSKIFLSIPLNGMLVLYVVLGYVLFKKKSSVLSSQTAVDMGWIVGFLATVYATFVLDLQPIIGDMKQAIWVVVGMGFFLGFVKWMPSRLRLFLSRLVIILIFAKLQFVTETWLDIAMYGVLVYGYCKWVFSGSAQLTEKVSQWGGSFLVIFAFVLILPTFPQRINALFERKSEKIVFAASGKIESYKNTVLDRSPRTSMWKSSFPWIKQYALLGSGPDTIKFMYPDFRRPEYGVLEGGHNFTPDRLHNEYLNTFATRGIPATLVFYIWLLFGWGYLLLSKLYEFKNHPYRYLIMASMASAGVYLGQVFFNFGVLATLFLFYTVVGFGHALVVHKDFEQ